MAEIVKWVLLLAGVLCLLVGTNHRAVSRSWKAFAVMATSAVMLALIASGI